MKAKLTNSSECSKIPAGIFTGTELFAKNGEIYAMFEGRCLHFEELPGTEKRSFTSMYLQDKEAQYFIKQQFGITGFESSFKKWLFCKFGSLDGNPDSINGKITPDTYNSACMRTDCPGRGKICGYSTNIKGYEVATIRELKSGKTACQVADVLCVSESAVKSRVEKLKEKFNVANVVALVAVATEIGI